jgi:hypothetical protein
MKSRDETAKAIKSTKKQEKRELQSNTNKLERLPNK